MRLISLSIACLGGSGLLGLGIRSLLSHVLLLKGQHLLLDSHLLLYGELLQQDLLIATCLGVLVLHEGFVDEDSVLKLHRKALQLLAIQGRHSNPIGPTR